MGAQEAERRTVERATATEQKLDAVQARSVENEATLEECLEALEAEWKARADVEQWVLSSEQEVIMLRGQLLRAKESIAWLCERVT